MEQLKIQLTHDKNSHHTNKTNFTVPYLNKYEYSRIIASRALQISNGSEIFIDDTNGSIDPIQIAKLEYEKNKLPFLISRQLPNGSTETFSLKDLKSFEMI